MALALCLCVVTLVIAHRRGTRGSPDAASFVADLDMRTLPEDAVICSSWGRAPPLWYAKYVLTKREDIEIINTPPQEWQKWIEALPNRPFFLTSKVILQEDYSLVSYRNVWRLERATRPEVPVSATTR